MREKDKEEEDKEKAIDGKMEWREGCKHQKEKAE